MSGAEDFTTVRAHKIHSPSGWPLSPSLLPPALILACRCHSFSLLNHQRHLPSPHDSVLGYAFPLELSRCSGIHSNHRVWSWQHVPITYASGRLDRALFSRPHLGPELEASLGTHPVFWVGKWPIGSVDAAPFFLWPLFVLCQGQLLVHDFLTQRRILYNI